MSNSKHRGAWDENEMYEWRLAKMARRRRRERGLEDKQRPTRPPGLRSQGEAGVVRPDRSAPANPLGRRAEPTRYDAMAIAGHQRLPGWESTNDLQESGARLQEPLEPRHRAEPPAPRVPSPDASTPASPPETSESPASVSSDPAATPPARKDDHTAAEGPDGASGSKPQKGTSPSADTLQA